MITSTDERCSRCGGELYLGQGVVALLACMTCGREIPTAALLDERSPTVTLRRLFHRHDGKVLGIDAHVDHVELHTRRSEISIPYEALEWLVNEGGPAALAARDTRRPQPIFPSPMDRGGAEA